MCFCTLEHFFHNWNSQNFPDFTIAFLLTKFLVRNYEFVQLVTCKNGVSITAVQWIQTYKTANSTAYSTASTQPTAWDLFTFILWWRGRLFYCLLWVVIVFLLWSWYPGVNKRWSSNKLFSFIGMQWKSRNPSLNYFNSKSNRLIITLRLSALSLNSCDYKASQTSKQIWSGKSIKFTGASQNLEKAEESGELASWRPTITKWMPRSKYVSLGNSFRGTHWGLLTIRGKTQVLTL